jgi:membrane-bound serine protease (ClpP class)
LELLIPIALILLGLGLVVVEVYLIPGMNVVGIVGVLMVVFALGYIFAEAGMTGGIVATLATIGAGGGIFYWMWRNGAWNRFILSTNLGPDRKTVVREAEQRARYLGRVGIAVTPLRPTGIVEIEGERIEVATEGEFISARSLVRVVAMDRRRYFVRLAEALEA